MKKILFLLFILFLVCFFPVINQEFKPSKIYFPNDWIKTEYYEPVPDILSGHKFRYLSKGRQSYAFESEDGKYVVKFLRYDKLQKPLWTRLRLFSLLADKEILRKEKKLYAWERCFTQIENLPLDFGIIYSHLSNEKGTITLMDKKGKPYLINIQNTRFFLQKKVVLLKNAFSQHDTKKLIENFLNAIVTRINKNVINKTSSCMENVGLIENEIIEYDFGEVYQLNRDFKKKMHFISFTNPLKSFLEKNFPEYVAFFDQKREQYVEMIHE